jgi:PAS domain S-box-containing protein
MAHLQAVLDTLAEGVLQLDADGDILACNRAAAHIFGLPEQTLRQRNFHELERMMMHEDLAPIMPGQSAVLQALRGTPRDIDSVLGFKRASGALIWLTVRCQSLHDEHMRPQGLFAAFTDITEQRQMEDKLAASREALEEAQEIAQVGSWTLHIPTRTLKWSAEAYRIFGRHQHSGIRLADFINATLADFRPTLQRALAGLDDSQAFDIEVPISAGEKPRWLRVRAVVRTSKTGQPIRAVGSIQDITERKAFEKQLEAQNENLEATVQQRTAELSRALDAAHVADRTKDAFLANVSHELRTPLNAVIGLARLARDLDDPPRQRDYLGKIVSAGSQLNRIINDLLDLSKIAAGQMEFEAHTFSPAHLLEQALPILVHRAEEKGLRITTHIDPTLPAALVGDPMRIEQIVFNLVGNAIKFTARGAVGLRLLHLNSNEQHTELAIEVSDTGIGIPLDSRERLFKPFSQADASISRTHGGTGLGLALCHHFATIMHGSIAVQSREGEGATFTVTLRLLRGDPANIASPTTAEEPPPTAYSGVKVLVVDDHPLNREIVDALLGVIKVKVRTAGDGEEALAILDAAPADTFDLVLMDIQMPVMDGLTATRAIRGRPRLAALPVIGMTAHTMQHEQKQCHDAGMNDHIGKPFNNAIFYRTLARWLPPHKQRRPEPVAPPQAAVAPASAAGSADLSKVTGLDLAAALARFAGSQARLQHWLGDFVTTIDATTDEIRKHVSAGQMEQAAALLHALKGRVGMLGLYELHQIVQAAELAVRSNAAASAALDRLITACVAKRAELAAVLGLSDAVNPR